MFRHIAAPLAPLQLLKGGEIHSNSEEERLYGSLWLHIQAFLWFHIQNDVRQTFRLKGGFGISEVGLYLFLPFFTAASLRAAAPGQGSKDLSPAPYQHILMFQGETICLEQKHTELNGLIFKALSSCSSWGFLLMMRNAL